MSDSLCDSLIMILTYIPDELSSKFLSSRVILGTVDKYIANKPTLAIFMVLQSDSSLVNVDISSNRIQVLDSNHNSFINIVEKSKKY